MLIHDAQHTAAELPAKADFGHSAVEYAVGLAEGCRAKQVLLFHHDPPRTDDELDAIVARQQGASVAVSRGRGGDRPGAAPTTMTDHRPDASSSARGPTGWWPAPSWPGPGGA